MTSMPKDDDTTSFLCRSSGREFSSRDEYVQHLNRSGLDLVGQERFREAWSCFQQALQVEPNCAELHNNCGVVLQCQEALEKAAACFLRALEIDPRHVEALTNLGNVFLKLGRGREAIRYYQEVLAIRHDSAEAHCNLGSAYRDLGELRLAEKHYRGALQVRPDLTEAHFNLGNTLESQERLKEAESHYRTYLDLRPDRALRELRILTMCPTVFPSNHQIDAYRERLLAGIEAFPHRGLQADVASLGPSICAPPYNLVYHGRDDLEIKISYANLILASIPRELRSMSVPDETRAVSQSQAGSVNRLPRIGFVVTKGHERAFAASMGGVLEHLMPGEFELVVVCALTCAEQVTRDIRNEAVRVLSVPHRLDHYIAAIQSQHFDLLYYWEVGTDATNYLLPFLRLAPVQCTSWGYPVTTGIPNMDVHLSSELLESHDADSHYSERLVCFKTLPTYQYRRSLDAAPKPREDFGFRADQDVYLCAQNLAKFHPEFDSSLAGILRHDGSAVVALIEDQYGYVASNLRARFAETIPDVSDRIVSVPRQFQQDYLSLINAADVLLDTPHYCGVTSTYDAFSFGKPIVTLPGQFQRSRYTAACYELMGCRECVAQDAEAFVSIAVELGTRPAYRHHVAQRIREGLDAVFEDHGAVREHERVFRELLR